MIIEHMSLFVDNKYTKWYSNIVARILKERPTKRIAKSMHGFIESHHIIPKSINKDLIKEKWNIVYCTPREHFLLHKLLVQMTKGTKYYYKMLNAIIAFNRNNKYQEKLLTARDYEYSKKCAKSLIRSSSSLQKAKDTNLEKYGVENPFQSEIIKQKIREAILDKYGVEHPAQSDEILQKMRNTNLEKYGVEYSNSLKRIIVRNYIIKDDIKIILGEYLSYLDAQDKTKISNGNIALCINGKINSSGIYNDKLKEYIKGINGSRKILPENLYKVYWEKF